MEIYRKFLKIMNKLDQLRFYKILIGEKEKMIKKIIKTKWKDEGLGGAVRRVIGNQDLEYLDPFLLLEHFKMKLPEGFQDHPHRGFESMSYMLSGKILYEDFKGNAGEIGPGDVQ